MTDGYIPGKSRRERSKIRFSRGMDRRIKTSVPSSEPKIDDKDIGDMWAQQEQIRLSEALEENQKRKERQQLKKERGLLGLAKTDLSRVTRRVKTELVGTQSGKSDKQNHQSSYDAKEIESFLSSESPVPRVKMHHRIWNFVSSKLSGISESMQPVIIAVAGIAAVMVLLFGGYVIFKGVYNHFHHSGSDYASNGKGSSVLGLSTGNLDPSTQKYKGTPDFKTITRDGKPASDYGGWFKVSTDNTDNPVYAYPDNLGGNILTVSERQVPPSVKADPSGVMPNVAKSLGADDKTLNADGTTIYLGTQKGGKQTAAFVKDNLLIVINSTETLKDQYWIAYAIRMV